VAAAVEVAAGEVAVAVAEVAVEVAVVVGASPRLLGTLRLTACQDGLEETAIPFATADGNSSLSPFRAHQDWLSFANTAFISALSIHP
jgi:hypothetical protein